MGDASGSAVASGGILLVGSVPFQTPEEVFTKAATLPGLVAIPDGETGERWNYIGWQRARFPQETLRAEIGGTPLPQPIPTYTLEDIQPTLYDKAAIDSYAEFVKLRNQGVIPANVRFQICLPTTYNNVIGHLKPQVQSQIDPLYQTRLKDSVRRIVEALPHDDIVIQWDLCLEVISLAYEQQQISDDHFKPWFTPIRQGVLDRVVRECEVIPSDVRIAFHLCYGDLGHKHFVEPVDLSLSVGFANDLMTALGSKHPIEWIHMPVPRSRIDAAYFKPLEMLDLGGKTRLFLGLVHSNDEKGTRERISAAQAAFPYAFGVATECGLGRTPREEIDSIFAISKAVTLGS